MSKPPFTHVHLIGIGGIHVSAVAKLLLRAGVRISGSDRMRSEITDELAKKGVDIQIGETPMALPPETDLILYSSAVSEEHPERAAGREKGIRQLNSFQFLGEWTAERDVVLVTGTHGKSTTTAMIGLTLAAAGLDPTVVVGSRVPGFPEGNVRHGLSSVWVIEGDEYAKHFLEFHPSAVVINNIEPDHFDVFPDEQTLLEAFRDLLKCVRKGGMVIANADDPRVSTLIGEERARLESQAITIRTFGFGAHADVQIADYGMRPGEQMCTWQYGQGSVLRGSLSVPGRMNLMNATAAVTLCLALQVAPDVIRTSLAGFTGIWRRFEKIAELGGVLVFSDYGHHPTAVRATLEAAKGFYPGRRIVLCFQPHHRHRTKRLFLDFIPSFDQADAIVLSEIYDVTGRDADVDADISSQDLRDALAHHDADRFLSRPMEYASTPNKALAILERWKKSGDVIIVMGAGDIYKIAGKIIQT